MNQSNSGIASSASPSNAQPKESPIGCAVSHLACAQQYTDELIALLHDRLQPVLSSALPTSKAETKSGGLSKMHDALCDAVDRQSNLNAALLSVIERITV